MFMTYYGSIIQLFICDHMMEAIMELEKVGEFFDNRLDGYEGHQLDCIDSARVFSFNV